MKNQPPVSVFIITCLGTEARGQLLKSVCENALDLRYPEFEVVVSDNAGPIPAEQALEGLKDPRLKIFRNEENVGFTGNMNLCLERCRYDIIKLHCDDDLLHPDFLNCTVPYIDDETMVVVDYAQYTIGNEPKELAHAVAEPPEVETRLAGYRNDIWRMPYISLPACTIFSRKLFTDIGGYDINSTATDWDFLIKARRYANVAHVKHVLSYMGIWEESDTQKQLKYKPFYFAYEGLYTRFSFLCDESLEFKYRMNIRFTLLRMFFWESMRLPKNFRRKNYWLDYGAFLKCLLGYILGGKKRLTQTPEKSA